MRYRIVTDRSPAENPKRPVVPRMPEGMRAVRSAPVAPSMFAPVAWPGTDRDVHWRSTPMVGRTPWGWGGQGFTL